LVDEWQLFGIAAQSNDESEYAEEQNNEGGDMYKSSAGRIVGY
jgi:hypothetical protein